MMVDHINDGENHIENVIVMNPIKSPEVDFLFCLCVISRNFTGCFHFGCLVSSRQLFMRFF